MATLYRCKAPTDLVCRCGKVARRLRGLGIEFQEVRVPFLKRDRPEIEELTGQRWVPVLVHGDEVVHDSHRILEYLDWLGSRKHPARPGARGSDNSKEVA
jgi:glutathione S-transferase